MLKVEFKKADVDMDIDEIAINNIVQCDKYLKKDFLMYSMIGWLNNNKKRNYQDMELTLRSKCCRGFLVAKKVNKVKSNMRLTMPNDNTLDKQYELDIVFDHNDILKYQNSYEDNFVKLKESGCYAYQNNPDEETNEELQKESKNDVKFKDDNLEYNLSQNSIYLTLTQMNNKETVEYITDCLEKRFNAKPDETKIGTINYKNEGEKDVYTLTINNKTITECAWVNLNNDDIDLIDLRRIKMELNDK